MKNSKKLQAKVTGMYGDRIRAGRFLGMGAKGWFGTAVIVGSVVYAILNEGAGARLAGGFVGTAGLGLILSDLEDADPLPLMTKSFAIPGSRDGGLSRAAMDHV